MKKYFLLALLLIVILLNSCFTVKKNTNTIDYQVDALDKQYMMDSIKINKLIVNRKSNLRIVEEDILRENGTRNIKSNFTNYCMNMMNLLICKDTSITKYSPVTLTVNQYDLIVQPYGYEDYMLLKFNMRFDYLDDTIPKKFTVIDSLYYNYHDFKATPHNLQYTINQGFRRATELFSLKKRGIIDSTINTGLAKYDIPPVMIKDSIHLSNLYGSSQMCSESKVGFMVDYNRGFYNLNGFKIAYTQFYRDPIRQNEWISSFGYSYDLVKESTDNITKETKNNYIMEAHSGIMYNKYIGNYNSGLYYGNSLFFILGEEHEYKLETNYVLGALVEQYIGLRLSDNVYLRAGAYMKGLLFSDLMPFDLGMRLSIGFTGRYPVFK